MKKSIIRFLCGAGTAFGLVVFSSGASFACACCANPGDRFVESVLIDEFDWEIIRALDFSPTADVSIGEQDYADVGGIELKSLPLNLTVERSETLWKFVFDDPNGGAGQLDFVLPTQLTKFEVDPRDPSAPEAVGGGPLLYKEWRLTSKAEGTGILQQSVGEDQRATLILQGRGNRCRLVSDFTAWSLVLFGSRGQVTLFGELEH